MTGQLRLTPAEGGAAPVLFDVDLPEGVLEQVRELSPAARLELAMRVPTVIGDLVTELAAVDSIPAAEVTRRISDYRRAIERLRSSLARRAQQVTTCAECGVRDRDAHLFGCSRAI